MTDPIAIDLSHHNTINSNADPDRAKAAGLLAVFHKATQGTGYIDPTFADRKDAAARDDITLIPYHFLEHGDVADQIGHFLDVAQPLDGERVVIDYEMDDCTLDDLHEAVESLLACAKNLQITVYSGHLIKDQLGSKRDDLLARHTSLWIAQYTTASAPSWPSGTWQTWSLWQYTDSGSLPGIDGGVDFNRFNGSDGNAAKWFAPAGATPRPEPDEQTDAAISAYGYSVDVSIDRGGVSISINGRQIDTT